MPGRRERRASAVQVTGRTDGSLRALWRARHQLELVSHPAEFGKRTGLHLLHRPAATHLHRSFGDADIVGNLFAQPPGQRDHHGLGDQVGGLNPGDFVLAGREAAADRLQRRRHPGRYAARPGGRDQAAVAAGLSRGSGRNLRRCLSGHRHVLHGRGRHGTADAQSGAAEIAVA